ncbi:MAG: peptidoglycan-binding protein [Hamadaea sp.]|nr:peptidoglycan-binding protein [Hamadaea sp.]
MLTFKRLAPVLAAAVLGTPLVSAAPAQALPVCQTWWVVTASDDASKEAFVPATWGGDTSCTLYQGIYNNEAVRHLQESMNLCYGMGLAEDGDFGSGTKAALREVQSRIGVTADGQYGVYTRDKMRHHPTTIGDICHRYNGPGGY